MRLGSTIALVGTALALLGSLAGGLAGCDKPRKSLDLAAPKDVEALLVGQFDSPRLGISLRVPDGWRCREEDRRVVCATSYGTNAGVWSLTTPDDGTPAQVQARYLHELSHNEGFSQVRAATVGGVRGAIALYDHGDDRELFFTGKTRWQTTVAVTLHFLVEERNEQHDLLEAVMVATSFSPSR